MPVLRLSIPTMLLASACAPHPFDPAAEQQRLLKRDAEWALAAAGKDVDKIVSYWTDDAVVIPPGQPVLEGKPAIRAFVAASQQIPGFKIHWTSTQVTFSPDGRMAYMQGTNETTMLGANGLPVTLHGRGLTVWRVEPDGQWRCVIDIWNDSPVAETPAK